MKERLTFFDLFAGIGGFRLGMERAGHRCIGFCEIDKFARQSYRAIHEPKGELEFHDITKVSDGAVRKIGRVDVLTGGFPCQSFSLAGNRRGFRDTRGTLFFEVARFASILRPRIIFLENVKGLLIHDHGDTFETILSTFHELGYDVEWEVLNSKNYVPQSRERVYIIGHLRGADTRKVFPVGEEEKPADQKSIGIQLAATNHDAAKQIVVGNSHPSGNGISGQVYHADGLNPTLTTKDGNQIAIPILTPDKIKSRQKGRRFKKDGEEMFTLTASDRHGIITANKLPGKFRSTCEDLSPEGISGTLNTKGEDCQQKLLIKEATKKGYAEATTGDSVNLAYATKNNQRGRVGKGRANTLLAGSQQGVVTEDFQIRKLTPMECWRLQAFPDWGFLAAKFDSKEIAMDILKRNLDHYDSGYEQKMSDSQLYKQAGNGYMKICNK